MASGEGTLTFKQRCALGTAHLMNGLCFQGMWFSYILVFFTKVIELPRPKAGLILLLAQFGGAVVTILVGVASDGCICAYGRRKIFHLLGMIIMLLTFVFLWIDCLDCENAPDGYKVLYYSSFAFLAQFGWSGMQLAQLTLIPELATDKTTRMQLNQIRYGLTTVTGLVVFAVFWILLATLAKTSDVSNITPTDKPVFWVMALIMVLLGFVITTPFQIWIHEKPSVGRRRMKILEWFRNPMFYLAICSFTTGRLITVITQQYIPFYLLDSLNMPKTSIAIGPMVWYLFSAVAAFLVHKFTKRLGDEMTYFLCLMLMFGSVLWIWSQPALYKTSPSFWNHYSAYIPIAMSGATGSCLAVISLTYMSTLTGANTGSAGFVWGAALFCDRISNGLVNIMIQNIPAELSSSPNFQRYVIVYANFGAGAIGLASVILIAIAKWREKKQVEYQLKAEAVAYKPEAPNINNLDITAPDPEPHPSVTFSTSKSLQSEQLEENFARTMELFISM